MKERKVEWGKINKISLYGINITYILALCLVLLPLLLVGCYNYPSADDWSYGKNAYKALASGGGIIDVLKCSFEMVAKHYMEWEGRFSNSFLASLQPGIWGEEYYCVVPWIMLGGLILGEVYLVASLFGSKNRKLVLPVIAPSLLMQILYTPSIVESFYWYTGAVNYTFMFAMSMVLYVLFLKIAFGTTKGWHRGLQITAAVFLSVLIGGDNFATSLSTFVYMLVLSIAFAIYDRKALARTWYFPLLVGGSLAACILAPGNMSRIEGNFGGETTNNAFQAIVTSLLRSLTNIYSWTNVKVCLIVLLMVPFIWMAVKNIKFDFKFPVLFTVLSFGVYASQITATIYVDGTTGGGRMAAVLYYSYHIWLLANTCYWVGWIRRNSAKWPERIKQYLNRVSVWVSRGILPYCAVCGILLCAIIYTTDLKEISSYKAYRDWRQGWAQQYAKEWDERLVILKNPDISNAEVAPLSVYPECILYTDLQPEDGYVWVNRDCAAYYGKESIVVKSADVSVTE